MFTILVHKTHIIQKFIVGIHITFQISAHNLIQQYKIITPE